MMVYAQQAAEAVTSSGGGSEGLIILSIIVNIAVFAFGYGKLSNEVKNTKSTVKSVKEDLESAIKNVKEDIRNVKEDLSRRIDRQGEKIDRVAEDLAELRGAFTMFKEASATRSTSPIVLTERGEEILQDSGGEVILQDMFEDIYQEFEGITSAYDIQRKARKTIEDLLDEDGQLEQVKEYLYEEGKVSVETVVDVLGIELRDMVFERRGMPIKKRPEEEPAPSMVRDAAEQK